MQENKQLKPSTKPTRRHRPAYKHPLFIPVIILIVAGAVFAVLYFTKKPEAPANSTVSQTTKTEPTQPSSNSQKETTQETAKENPDPTDSSVSPDGKTPAQYDGADPNQGEALTGSITAARFDGDKLIVRLNIDQYLSSGTCELALSDGTNQLQKSANLVPSAATSTCEGFDVASSELSNFSRPLNININLTSGNKTGLITGVVE